MAECSAILGYQDAPGRDAVEAYDSYHEGYGAFTAAGREAIISAARLEGLLLDPVYTGKAMAGLADLVRKRVLDSTIPTVFIHTGGLPILFAYEQHFRDLAAFTRV
jgi:1-aminocyclopropane-1-carboxylate deaminase/D-cysteine desulfhydrase-like pyridoxal-dependent ACC family enzyme